MMSNLLDSRNCMPLQNEAGNLVLPEPSSHLPAKQVYPKQQFCLWGQGADSTTVREHQSSLTCFVKDTAIPHFFGLLYPPVFFPHHLFIASRVARRPMLILLVAGHAWQ